MKRTLGTCHGAIVLCVVALTAGCASSRPAAPPSSSKAVSEPSTRCRGTLGIEAVPISRQMRKKLALPEGVHGATVSEVLPGGPATAAGVRPNDVVEEIGTAHVANDCDFVDAGFGRSCEPVRVVLLRAGSVVEKTLVPIDQDSFWEQSCRDGVASGCFRQAWDLWNRSRGEGSDRDRALVLYEKACRAGSAEACAHEGLYLTDRPDRAHDAAAALGRACDLGSGAGCAHLAFLYATGTLVARDDRRATPLYVRSCDLGDPQGCYNVAVMADDGRGVARDVARAVARYEEACQMGSSAACTNLGFHYEKGRGVQKNGSRAFALYQRGCAGTSCQPSNLTGCINVGRAYRDAIGVAKDAARSAKIFRDACDRKPRKNDPDAVESGSRACSLLGDLYLDGNGVEKDIPKGRELLEQGCERGDSFGCFNAATVYAAGGGDANAARAASFFERACKAGDADGCFQLALACEKGKGVSRDPRRAKELLRKACALGFEQACAKQGR
jgi:uncharacterized protein